MVDYVHLAADYPEAGQPLIHFLKQCEAACSDSTYNAPAKELEHKHGLHAISGNWRMPEGYDESTIEREITNLISPIVLRHPISDDSLHPIIDDLISKAEVNAIKKYNYVLNQLLELNPELAAITMNNENPEDFRHIILGCTSQFNIDDIQFFLRDRSQNKALRNEPAYRASLTELSNITGKIEWVPSPQTMGKIRDQLHERRIGIESDETSTQEAKSNNYSHIAAIKRIAKENAK